jgi:hypothetical protein
MRVTSLGAVNSGAAGTGTLAGCDCMENACVAAEPPNAPGGVTGAGTLGTYGVGDGLSKRLTSVVTLVSRPESAGPRFDSAPEVVEAGTGMLGAGAGITVNEFGSTGAAGVAGRANRFVSESTCGEPGSETSADVWFGVPVNVEAAAAPPKLPNDVVAELFGAPLPPAGAAAGGVAVRSGDPAGLVAVPARALKICVNAPGCCATGALAGSAGAAGAGFAASSAPRIRLRMSC